MRHFEFVVIAAFAAPAIGCYHGDMSGQIQDELSKSRDLDKNKTPDIEQTVVAADGPRGSNSCLVIYDPIQAVVPCDEAPARGYGCGAYEGWDDATGDGMTNWESGCVDFEEVFDVDGNAWCGATFRPGQEYRITTAADWAVPHEGDGWSDHGIGATKVDLEGWVDIRSEGAEGCFFEPANIVFGCDATGHAYKTEGANLGERDPSCGG